MKKHLKTLATAMLCLAMALLVSCKKDNTEPSGGGTGGDTPTPTNMINGHEYVDLGLPSGLLWATCNVGAKFPEEFGDYYAWGESIVKSKYDHKWAKYKWCNYIGGYNYDFELTKYNTDSDEGIVDNKMILELEDDAAYMNWGNGWRMPTYYELNELRTSCTWEWTTQNGVNGMKVVGANGKSIFMPAADHIDLGPGKGEKSHCENSYGYYWSSSLCTTDRTIRAFDLHFYSDDCEMQYYNRCCGMTVRPVSAPQN